MKSIFRKFALVLVFICMIALVLPVNAAEERINLYNAGGGSGPQNVRGVGDIAIKFTVPNGKMLKVIAFENAPTWEKEDSTGEIVLYKWNTDYATTVAGKVLERHSELHKDNADFKIEVKGYCGPGTYLLVMLKDKATNDLGTWTNSKNDSGAVTYVNGSEVSYMAKSYMILDADNPPTSDATTIFAYVLLAAAAGVIVFKRRTAIL